MKVEIIIKKKIRNSPLGNSPCNLIIEHAVLIEIVPMLYMHVYDQRGRFKRRSQEKYSVHYISRKS